MADVIRGQQVNTLPRTEREVSTEYVSGSINTEKGNYGLLTVLAPTSTLYNGRKTVTSAGTAEALSGSTFVKTVCIKPLSTNSNNIYIGNSSVTSTTGYPLPSGESISIDINNLNKIYLDVDTNGEGVSYLAVS